MGSGHWVGVFIEDGQDLHWFTDDGGAELEINRPRIQSATA